MGNWTTPTGARTSLWRVLALLAALALVATACNSEGEDVAVGPSEADDEITEESTEESSDGDSEAEPDEEPSDEAPAPEQPEESGAGGDIIVGVGAINPDLDAFSATSPPRSFYTYPVYSLMTRVDTLAEEPEVMPGVAESWERLDDLTWEFTLREDLTFPNGEPVDATAVEYSINFMLDPENEAGIRGKLSIIDSVEVIDDFTVQINMNAPEAILPRLLGAQPIVPPELHAEIGAEEFNLNPIGTGPFMVEEFVPGERLVLVPNPDSGQGEAAPSSVTFELIPEDAARVAALQAEDVHIITKVPIDSIGSLEGDGLSVLEEVEPRTYVVDMFTEDGLLSDQVVRTAFAHAIDQETLIEGIMGGQGEAVDGQLAPTFLSGHCEDVEQYDYDPALADQMLADAGYSGLELTYQTSQGFLLNDSLLAQAIASQIESLEAVDSVEIEVMEFSQFLEVYYIEAPRADLYAWGMSSSPFVDASVQYERFVTDYPQHNLGYSNPDYDAAWDRLRQADTDTPERQEAFCDLATILKEDAPQLMVMAMPDIWATAPEVEGFIVDQAGNPAWQFVMNSES